MNEELEPEVLSYREFRNREALLAWERRRRAYELQAGERSEERGRAFMVSPRRLVGAETLIPPR
jgi:hypothetical protein